MKTTFVHGPGMELNEKRAPGQAQSKSKRNRSRWKIFIGLNIKGEKRRELQAEFRDKR